MVVEIVRRARAHGGRTAIDEGPGGRVVSHGDLAARAEALAARLLDELSPATGRSPGDRDLNSPRPADGRTPRDGRDLDGARIAYLTHSGVDSVAALWAIWLAGGIAVPLALSHPEPELAYTVSDCGAVGVVASSDLAPRIEDVTRQAGAHLTTLAPSDAATGMAERNSAAPDPTATTLDLPAPAKDHPAAPATDHPAAPRDASRALPEIDPARPALIVYTSGSTGRPKGAVWSHRALQHQVETLVDAWRWSPQDRALLLLPLHHVHGLVNVVTCGLWAGAAIRVLRDVDVRTVWSVLADDGITVFMAVPTIYYKLLDGVEHADEEWRTRVTGGVAHARLMVSGSAALPVDVLERWHDLTGHVLLERYGMTEIGMALSNPYEGPRVAGTVGYPLPGVEVRVVDDHFDDVTSEPAVGQLLVRGPGVFSGYWERPEATGDAFHDGWFVTGDAVERREGRFRIRGRMNVDIIKTGGYKISALEIEQVLRTHPSVADCAVVGLDDPEWGQTVAAAVVPVGRPSHVTDPDAARPTDGCGQHGNVATDRLVSDDAGGAGRPGDADADALSVDELDVWLRSQLAPYKVPRRTAFVSALPRNALGKVVKPRVAELFSS